MHPIKFTKILCCKSAHKIRLKLKFRETKLREKTNENSEIFCQKYGILARILMPEIFFNVSHPKKSGTKLY